MWRLDDLKQPWKKHKWSANGGVVFPDCRTAATYHQKDLNIVETKLWDLATGQLLATFPNGERKGHIRFLDFPVGGTIYLGNYHNWNVSTTVWDISGQPKLLAILLGNIDVSKDHNWMLQSAATGASLVSLRSGREISLTRKSDQPIWSSKPTSSQGAQGRFSPDSRMVAVTGIYPQEGFDNLPGEVQKILPSSFAGQGRPITRLWDVETGGELATFDGGGKVLFSPDSKILAALQKDGTIRLWDASPRKVVWQMLGSAIAVWLFLYLSIALCKKLRPC